MTEAIVVGAIAAGAISLAGMFVAFFAGMYRERSRSLARGHELRAKMDEADRNGAKALEAIEAEIADDAAEALAEEGTGATDRLLGDYSE